MLSPELAVFLNWNIGVLAIALGVLFLAYNAVVQVDQSMQFVVERFGKYRCVLSPGISLIVPFIDRVKPEHRISILERPVSGDGKQDAITQDNVPIGIEAAIFYRIIEPQLTVYRISNVDLALRTTVRGVVRSEIGKLNLDDVQSNRDTLTVSIKMALQSACEAWGISIERTEIVDIALDAATRSAMALQLNAERTRRATEATAEGDKKAAELAADAELYTAQKTADARRIEADAEAYATQVVAAAIKNEGMESAQYQIAMKQIEAIGQLASSSGASTIVLPSSALEMFGEAFKLLAPVAGKKPTIGPRAA